MTFLPTQLESFCNHDTFLFSNLFICIHLITSNFDQPDHYVITNIAMALKSWNHPSMSHFLLTAN